MNQRPLGSEPSALTKLRYTQVPRLIGSQRTHLGMPRAMIALWLNLESLVETVGADPTTATLARRARYRASSPRSSPARHGQRGPVRAQAAELAGEVLTRVVRDCTTRPEPGSRHRRPPRAGLTAARLLEIHAGGAGAHGGDLRCSRCGVMKLRAGCPALALASARWLRRGGRTRTDSTGFGDQPLGQLTDTPSACIQLCPANERAALPRLGWRLLAGPETSGLPRNHLAGALPLMLGRE